MTFIIAEAGVNHNGSLREAEKLIVAAKRCGADAVKFQLFDADKLKRPEIKHLQIGPKDMYGLAKYAERQGIQFLCTPFDVLACGWVATVCWKIKIASGCINDYELLQAASDTNLPIILSTGMATPREIENAYVRISGSPVTLLHCTSAYPCPPEDVNLKAMDTLHKHFGCPVGYSDHTQGITAAIAAVARGATIIEKHLTLNRGAVGPDHWSSIEPGEFKQMVQAIRQVETMLGDGEKRPRPSEEPCMRIWK